MTQPLFLIVKCFQNFKQPEWPTRYLHDRTARLTSIMAGDFEASFWPNYGKKLREADLKKTLLFRAKSIDSTTNSVCLTQIWSSEEAFQEFLRQVGAEEEFENALAKHDLTCTTEREFISVQDAIEKVHQVQKRPHLIQFANPPFLADGMIVGDPLKASPANPVPHSPAPQ